MIAGPLPIYNRYNVSRGPVDELVTTLFYLSVLITFMLVAHRLIYQMGVACVDAPKLSTDLHKPWIRRWMTRGWGIVLFWFAWAWLLLNYLP